ncbi:taste receptor type 1 member 3-like [Pleurodeles waltl]|uniref:taste receptor type 1 member 3-like n=1 Tax=Pleurodeles waltl TaxID=8319 RepID=UPI003709AAC5
MHTGKKNTKEEDNMDNQEERRNKDRRKRKRKKEEERPKEEAGQYMLGGLFNFGTGSRDMTYRFQPEVTICERFYAPGFVLALAMRFAIEEINNSTSLLPGVQLGYEIYNTCFEPLVTMQPTMLFLTRRNSTGVDVTCNYTDYETRVIAVVGPMSSELCIYTAKLFGLFMVPQVSYAASSNSLSDRVLFPSFYRTIPSDKHQTEGLVEVIHLFKWNWIAAIGSDDAYGQQGLALFSTLASSQDICIAFEGTIPNILTESFSLVSLHETIKQINYSLANVIVLFSGERAAKLLLEEWIRIGAGPKVWLASEDWATSTTISSIPGLQRIGTVLGFAVQGGQISGFESYLSHVLTAAARESLCWSPKDGFIPSAKCDSPETPHCMECSYISISNILSSVEASAVYRVHTAVYSIAHSLHNLLNCNSSRCQPPQVVKSWQLLEKMKKVQFQLDNKSFYYDDHGNPNTGYSIVLWTWRNETLYYSTIGNYMQGLHLDKGGIQWHTADNEVPASVCSDKCSQGQVKRVKGFHSCCYDCVDCEAGFFQNDSEDQVCTPCPDLMWSPARSSQCYNQILIYLSWDHPLAMLLLVLTGFIMILILAIASLFLKNIRTPLVQVSGGPMCFVNLLSLLVGCGTSGIYMGKPTEYKCAVQQPLLAFCLTACLTSLLIKSLEIVLASEVPRFSTYYQELIKGKGGWVIMAVCLLIQSAVCIWYISVLPPMVQISQGDSEQEMLVHCVIQSWLGFALLLSISGGMACACFLCTFMVHSLPRKYNLAQGITYAMLMYFIAWIFFLPTYSTVQPLYQPAVQVCVILLCTQGILGAFFLPKCYLIWFRPERNTVTFMKSSSEDTPSQDISKELQM